MNRKQKLHVTNIFSFFILLLFNFILPFNERLPSIEKNITNLFQPADYAFMIWGLIYILLAIWLYQQLSNNGDTNLYLQIGYWLPINFLLNALWLPLFTNQHYIVAFIDLLAILYTLIIIYATIQNSRNTTFFFRLPFSLYMGWSSLAILIQLSILFDIYDVYPFLEADELGWTIIFILLGGIASMAVTLINRDVVFSLVFIWGLVALIIEQHQNFPIVIASWMMVAALALTAGYQIFRFLQGNRQGRI